MKPSTLLKTASVLLLFFAFSHTFGLLHRTSRGVEVDAVESAMHTAHFQILGASRTLWDFYVGFGLLLTVFLLFSALLAWQFSRLVAMQKEAVRLLVGPFFVAQAAVAVLSWTNFFLAPALVSTLVAGCLALAVWQLTWE